LDKLLDLEIVSSEKIAAKGKIESISAPGTVGEFQVLYNHAPLVSSLGVGLIRIVNEFGEKTSFSTSGGIFEVRDNKVTILAETIESKEEIDIERAKKSIKRAEDRLKSGEKGIDIRRAQYAIKRSLNRLKTIE
jgi:F-type H+-transporting ATPase subunit epsilon